MDVFVVTQLNDLPEAFVKQCLELIPDTRRQKVQHLRTENRQRQSLLAYILLVYALWKHDGKLQLPELTAQGKPRIQGREDLHCSLSHCPSGAAAVVYHAPIGVDMETVRPYNPKLARYICSAEEVLEIESSEDPALAFTILWTKKESCVKLYGASVGPGMKQIADRFGNLRFETKIGADWVLTTCWEE